MKLAIGFCNDEKTIVKFSKCKVCQQVLRVKKELKNIDPSEFDFPEGTAILINESLCSYYKVLWNKCKKLWGKEINIHVLYLKWEYLIQSTHIMDFKKNFPDIDINDL